MRLFAMPFKSFGAFRMRGGALLPFTDTFARANGAVGNGWTGATWTIATNQVLNTPTPGTEKLTDGGLEANYTAGLCDSLVLMAGSPTLAQSADAHGGTKAQAFTAAASGNIIRFPLFAAVAKTWYVMSGWGKRLSGSNTNAQMTLEQSGGSAFHYNAPIVDAAYAQKKISYYAPNTNNVFVYAVREYGSSSFCAVVVDDYSVYPLTTAELLMTRNFGVANVVVKADWTVANKTHCGLVARVDSVTNPQNYILATVSISVAGQYFAALHKVIAGALTTIINNTYIANGDITGKNLEVRCSGTTISLWFDNAQVGTNQTVDVAAINNNAIHGVFSTDGGNKLNRFFAGVP